MCTHDLQTFVHNVTKDLTEFMCLKCGWSESDK